MKKFISMTLGMLAAAAVIAVTPATVKAQGMPCTEATLKEFQANKIKAEQELAQVEAVKAQADANVVALKAQGVTGLALLQATDAATNAANMVQAYKGKVANCQASIDAIVGRGAVEQYYLDMEAKWKDRAVIDGIETQLKGAQQIAGAALTQLNSLKSALAGQQANAASNPSLAANVTALQAQVAAAEADYANKKATVDALAAQYAQQKATLNWATNADNAAYGKFVEDYGTNLATQYKLYNEETQEWEPIFTYYSNVPKYDVRKPNEWSIRWFE